MGGVRTSYYWNGNSLSGVQTGSDVLYFYYGSDQKLEGFSLNGTNYLYLRDAIGTINGILDADGTLAAQYLYDAWGNILSVLDGAGVDVSSNTAHIANVNPFRYRGYFYDADTGFYYLQSRYYDPVVGRFISPEPNIDYGWFDEGAGLLGYNIYAYCANNPVNYSDPSGEWLVQLICGVAGAAAFGTVAYIVCSLLGVDGKTRRLITAGFALIGGVLGTVFGPSLVGKVAPKALNWVKNLEKIINSKSRLRPMIIEGQTIIGFVWNNKFMIGLHFKHIKEPEKGMHITIQHYTGKNWRKTVPDIPIKSLGKAFINWVKNFFK